MSFVFLEEEEGIVSIDLAKEDDNDDVGKVIVVTVVNAVCIAASVTTMVLLVAEEGVMEAATAHSASSEVM